MPGSRQPTHNAPDQPSLFFPALAEQPETREDSLVRLAPLTSGSTLGACALPYAEHLRLTDHSAYTITCFLSDLRLLTEYLGRDRTLSSIVRGDVSGWLTHLKWERGAPPAPKTMARRITFLKNFFGWLASTSLLPTNLAANIALSRPAPPLPELLYDDEVRRLEDAAAADVRCHLLVMLLLATGLKKEEVAHLRLQDVDLSDPEHPTVEIHFPGQAKRRRERRMELPPEWTAAFERYVERYQPQEYVFECTDRNLNYVLAAAVKRARIEKRVTLQLLRDIYAVRQLRAGASMETLRERLGLSEEAWYETAEKYRKLAFPA
jgi:integrase/recombinase XerD